MSTHYTPSKTPLLRLIRWKPLIFEILIPLMLIISAVSAFVDGVPYAYYVLGVTWAYIMLIIGRAHGAERALQAHAVVACVWFTARGLMSVFAGAPEVPISTLLMAGLVCGIAAAVVQIHYRIGRLETPTANARAADFPGIYRITCAANQMQYIGQTSRAIKVRWHDHTSDLNAGRHHNPRMQLDWNRYGGQIFTWEVLEVVTDPVWLYDRERYWQNLDYETTQRYNPPNIPRGKQF